MKKIKLTKGAWAIIDDSDFDYINSFKWNLGNDGYAVRTDKKCMKKRIFMHRLINNTPNGLETDHINGNKIDNRHSNLRSVTRSQNVMNTNLQSNNTSGYRGVYFHKLRNKWVSSIGINGKRISLGYFNDIKDAIIAYKEAFKIYFGEYRRQYCAV